MMPSPNLTIISAIQFTGRFCYCPLPPATIGKAMLKMSGTQVAVKIKGPRTRPANIDPRAKELPRMTGFLGFYIIS